MSSSNNVRKNINKNNCVPNLQHNDATNAAVVAVLVAAIREPIKKAKVQEVVIGLNRQNDLLHPAKSTSKLVSPLVNPDSSTRVQSPAYLGMQETVALSRRSPLGSNVDDWIAKQEQMLNEGLPTPDRMSPHK